MTRLIILDLQTEATDTIFNFFFQKEERKTEGGSISKISITSKTIGDYLLIPPFRGYDCTTAGYMGGASIPPRDVPGLEQWPNLWRQEMMDYYIKKGVPLVGFGHSALLIWERLGGRIGYNDQEGLFAMENKKLALFENNSFKTNTHLGYFGSLIDGLAAFESHLAGHRPDSDDDVVKVKVPV